VLDAALAAESAGALALGLLGVALHNCHLQHRADLRALKSAEERAAEAEACAERQAAAAARQVLLDPLTGLLARSSIDGALEAALATGPAAVAFIDLDGFKAINDSAGHHVGDEVLRVVARRLAAVVRSRDACFRVGGDEFVVVSSHADEEAAAVLGRRLLGVLADPASVSGRRFPVSASVGIAVISPGTSTERALAAADAAMYLAKRSGGNRLHVAGRETSELLPVEMAAALGRALANGELEQHYQPLLQIATGDVIGFEALARWSSSELGRQVAPSEFIPVAESAGLISQLGEWALRTGLTQAALWSETIRPLRISVNVSALQLAEDGFCDLVAGALAESGVRPNLLMLEITEGTATNHAETIERLRPIRAMGVRISLDDFGTGHSSLARLAELEVDELKIDRTFVSRSDDPLSSRVIQFVAGVAADLGCEVVAEGVEDSRLLDRLAANGVGIAQGWCVGKPMSATDTYAWLKRRSAVSV